MNTITILKIKSVAWGAEKLLMMGLSFKHQAKLTGGSSRSVLSESGDTLVVMLENVPEERIRLLSDATADFARREGCDYECTRIHHYRYVFTDGHPDEHVWYAGADLIIVKIRWDLLKTTYVLTELSGNPTLELRSPV